MPARKPSPAKNGTKKAPPDNAERIAALRQKLGLTQQGFGELLGLSMVTVSRWEHEHSVPNEPSLMLLALLERALKRKKPADVIDALHGVKDAHDSHRVDVQRVIALVNLGN